MTIKNYIFSALSITLGIAGFGIWQAMAAPQPNQDPKSFIVVFKDSVSDPEQKASDMAQRHGLALDNTYKRVIKGFSARIPEAKLKEIKDDAEVDFISEDREVSTNGKNSGISLTAPVVPTGIKRIQAISSTNLGAGITVAVIDTGIDLTHPDLSSAILANKNCLSSRKNGQDDNGHGTHVAGTIAARDNNLGVVGVAPRANLVAVKVLNSQGSGTWSSIICGIDWVTANAATYNIKVANMSLGGPGSNDNNCGKSNADALHLAICRSRDAGVTYVVAAGNESANTSLSVPASYDDAVITVSALADSDGAKGGLGLATSYGPDDTFASFSNYGQAVDIAAPGVSILSTWLAGTYKSISGTSMATPHVSGAAAKYFASHPTARWTDFRQAIISAGEALGAGHTDPSNLHSEPVLQVSAF